MNSYTATEAKRYFGQILDECLFEKKAIPVQRHGRIIAYLVPSEKWVEPQVEQVNKPLEALIKLQTIRERHSGKKTKGDSVLLLKNLREERTNHLMQVSKKRALK